MAGPFGGIHMASNALRSFQRALDTTGHNLANVNTQGYSRQTVDFESAPPRPFYNGGYQQLGQGVQISTISRIRDGYLDASLNNSSSQYGKASQLAGGIQGLERVFNEPSDNGIAASLEKFFNAWSGLGSDPTNPSALAQVRNSGQTLADQVRTKFADLRGLEAENQFQVNSTIQEIDSLAKEIAALNKEIVKSLASGGIPNDMMDQRDIALNDLSKLVDIKKETFPDGQYAVYAAGFTLVDSGGSRPFPTTYDAATSTVTDGSLTYSIRSGELAGLFGSMSEITNQKASLDQLANSLRTEINGLHSVGINSLGNSGVNFFNDVLAPPQTGAIDFDLSVDVKADARAIASGVTGEDGDGGLALTIAQMRDSSVVSLGTKSFGDYFQDEMSRLAHEGSFHRSAMETEESIREQIVNQQQAVSGVSIDDEMANLMRFQRSYQAAARALTVFDQVAEDLIGMLRR